MRKTVILGLAAIFVASGAAPALAAAAAPGEVEYVVRITNLTAGEVFTPILVVTHEPGVALFRPGTPASVPLEYLAESGNTDPLEGLLKELPEVEAVGFTDGPVPPGQTAMVRIHTRGPADRISLAGMLVPTNDAIVAVNSVPAPAAAGSSMVLATAWDAGTEKNDEDCASIPGPPSVCNGEGFNKSRQGDVNFVHVHSGIHGIEDLAPEDHDWKNPVARVVITRMPGEGPGPDDEDDDESGDDGSDRRKTRLWSAR